MIAPPDQKQKQQQQQWCDTGVSSKESKETISAHANHTSTQPSVDNTTTTPPTTKRKRERNHQKQKIQPLKMLMLVKHQISQKLRLKKFELKIPYQPLKMLMLVQPQKSNHPLRCHCNLKCHYTTKAIG